MTVAQVGVDDAVRLSHVTAGYGDRIALADVDLRIPAGSLLAIIGPNGAGKSTLLRTIAGLLRPMAGSVVVFGGPPADRAKRFAYVPQAELIDWAFPITVGDVVMMGRTARIGVGRGPGAVDRDAVDAAIRQVGLSDLVRQQIGRLSGGQRRRAFLARAIAAAPDLYLLDEPVTGVDVTTQEDLMAILASEVERGRTVVATTHDLASAARHFREVAFINGRVVATGPADLALDAELLAATYGRQVVVLPQGRGALVDDAHHHDTPPAGERHFHEEAR